MGLLQLFLRPEVISRARFVYMAGGPEGGSRLGTAAGGSGVNNLGTKGEFETNKSPEIKQKPAEVNLDNGQQDEQLLEFLRKEMEKKVGREKASEKMNDMMNTGFMKDFLDAMGGATSIDRATLDSSGQLKIFGGGRERGGMDLGSYFAVPKKPMQIAAEPKEPLKIAVEPAATAESASVKPKMKIVLTAEAQRQLDEANREELAKPITAAEMRNVTLGHEAAVRERSADVGRLAAIAPKGPAQIRAATMYQEQLKADQRSNNQREIILSNADKWGTNMEDLKSVVEGPLSPREVDISIGTNDQAETLHRENFEKAWRSYDGTFAVDQLLQEAPSGRTNPLREQRWTTEQIRDLFIKGSKKFSDKTEISFDDVSQMIYDDQIPRVRQQLAAQGLKYEAGNVGDETKVMRAVDNDLMDAYADIKELEKDKNPKVREDAQKAKAVLQDYIEYSARLVQMIGNLKYNPARATAEGGDVFKDNGDVARATRNIFGEKNDGAYLAVMNEARTQRLRADGTFERSVDADAAVRKYNELLKLGIATYNNSPKAEERPLSQVIADLNREGVYIDQSVMTNEKGETVHTNRPPVKVEVTEQNLYDVLKMKSEKAFLNDSNPQDRALPEVESARKLFMNEGYDRLAATNERKNGKAAEALNNQTKIIKLSPEAAAKVGDNLRKQGVSEETIKKIEANLTIGVGVMLTKEHPNSYGAGFEYRFDNNVIIGFGVGANDWPPKNVTPGLDLGYRIEVTEDVEITPRVGVAANGQGIAPGASLSLTIKGEEVDFQAQAGIVSGGLGAGAGMDWAKSTEHAQAAYDEELVNSGVKEIEDSGQDPYEYIRSHPSKFPEIEKFRASIERADLPEDQKQNLFNSEFARFKQRLAGKALENTKRGWEQLIPTGMGLNVVKTDQGFLVPYFSWTIDGDVEVSKVESSDAKANEISNTLLAEAVSKKLGKQSTDVRVIESAPIRADGDLVFEGGKLKLSKTREAAFDASKLMGDASAEAFRTMRRELKNGADILVEPAGSGRVKITPEKADGDTKIFIDPALKDAGILTSEYNPKTKSTDLYLSISHASNLVVQRRDVTFPKRQDGDVADEHTGVKEETVIVIADANNPNFNNVIDRSALYMHQLPGTDWMPREYKPLNGSTNKQDNILSAADYAKKAPTLSDRVQFKDNRLEVEARQDAVYRLRDAMSAGSVRGTEAPRISSDMKAAIAKLTTDVELQNDVRKAITIAEKNDNRDSRQLMKDYESFLKKVNEKLNGKANPFELQYALAEILKASFKKNNNPFERARLTAMLRDQKKLSEEEITETVDWVLSKTDAIPMDAEGIPAAVGSHNSMAGGYSVIGQANWTTTEHQKNDPAYSLVGKERIDNNPEGPAKRLTDMYLAERRRTIFNSGVTENLDKPDRVDTALHTAFVLRFMDLVRKTNLLSTQELNNIADVYASEGVTNEQSRETLKKVFGYTSQLITAERDGKKEVQLNADTKIILDSRVNMAALQACRNFNVNIEEGLILMTKTQSKPFNITGAQAEYVKSLSEQYERGDWKFAAAVGFGIPSVGSDTITLNTGETGHVEGDGVGAPAPLPQDGVAPVGPAMTPGADDRG